MKSFGITCAILLVVAVSLCKSQSTNPLVVAHTSAMRVQQDFESEVDFFRERLTWQATDLGYYFTARMRLALMEATTEQQGAALRVCARNAAEESVVHIANFHRSVTELEDDSTALHQTVWEQLMETNIMDADEDLFYYYHRYRLEDAELRMLDYHLIQLGSRWFEIFNAYLQIDEEMFECIEAAFGRK